MELRGWIIEISEFGWEGSQHIFEDEAHFDSPSGNYQREGVHWLKHGDALTILNPDGSILWDGTLPADVEPAVWNGWFRSNPPMRAILRPASSYRLQQNALAEELVNSGHKEFASGNLDSAALAYLKAIEIWQELLQSNPKDTGCKYSQAEALSYLGYVEYNSGQYSASKITLSRAIELWEALLQLKQRDFRCEFQLARAVDRLAKAEYASGQTAATLVALHRAVELWEALRSAPISAIEVWEALYGSNPLQKSEYRLADTLFLLGCVECIAGHPDAARTAKKRAIEIWHDLVVANPKVLGYQNRLAEVLVDFGATQGYSSDPDTNHKDYGRVIEIWLTLIDANPVDKNHQYNLATMLFQHANFERESKQDESAERGYSRAIEICDKLVNTEFEDYNLLFILGVSQYRAGRYADSAKTLANLVASKKILTQGTKQPIFLILLAMAHWQLGQKDEAEAIFYRAQDLMKLPENYQVPENQTYCKEAAELFSQ